MNEQETIVKVKMVGQIITSEALEELATALHQFQENVPSVPRNGLNKHLGNKYATLDDLRSGTRARLHECGLVPVQLPVALPDMPDHIGLATRLLHAPSGQWLEATMAMPDDSWGNKGVNAAQIAGGIISYMCRYALGPLLGIVSDDDSDGHTGTTATQRNVLHYGDGSVVAPKAYKHYAEYLSEKDALPTNRQTLVDWFKEKSAPLQIGAEDNTNDSENDQGE